ncbi:MAG: hypothetical protein ACLPPF_16715 [Rhodomicrobium sp.]
MALVPSFHMLLVSAAMRMFTTFFAGSRCTRWGALDISSACFCAFACGALLLFLFRRGEAAFRVLFVSHGNSLPGSLLSLLQRRFTTDVPLKLHFDAIAFAKRRGGGLSSSHGRLSAN